MADLQPAMTAPVVTCGREWWTHYVMAGQGGQQVHAKHKCRLALAHAGECCCLDGDD